MKKLNVYYENDLVGQLSENGKQELCFSYINEWQKSEVAIEISPDLSLSDQLYQGEEVESFFENLLPEGDVCKALLEQTMLEAVIGLGPNVTAHN
ncbi:MAG: HipA N-terminal domain-containing protein [Methylococcaceae bacterium]